METEQTAQARSGALEKALFAFVLLLPGGLVAAPMLWLARKRWQRRAAAPPVAQAAA